MDPFLVSLAIAVATGISTVAGKLLDKGVVEPALEPATDKLKRLVQSGVKAVEKDDALARAVLAAIEDACGKKDESLAIEYARRIRLHAMVEPGNEAIRDEVMCLVYLASSQDPGIVPDTVLTALHLPAKQRPTLARFLFHLRRRLSALPDFRPLLDAAHQQTVEAELKRMAGALVETPEGLALRVRPVEPEWNAEHYLSYLTQVCNLLQLGTIDPQYAAPTGERTISLIDVYTNLEVTATVPVEKEPRDRKRKPSREPDTVFPGERGETRRLTALEAVSDPNKPRVALLGDPGSGKSTFLNYLTFCLAMARLEPGDKWLERLTGWTQGVLLPVRVVLRDWMAWAGTLAEQEATAQRLWDFIQHDLTAHGLGESFAPLKKHLQDRGGLVLLDGLDEVPDAQARRQFVKAVFEDFARACGRCRLIVTCRPYAYEKREWKLSDFGEHTLATFSPKQIEEFIGSWYGAVRQTHGMDAALAQSKAAALVAATRLPHLAGLAQRPLLLTLMATLHTSRGKLPDDRADLYEDCVNLLLDWWQQSKVTRAAGQEQTEKGVLDALGLPRSQLEQALNRVAFEAHWQQGQMADRKLETADISGEALRRALAPALGDSLDKAKTVIRYIQTRAGLLLDRGSDTFTFPHRTFQEFLAARHVLNSEEFPYNLAEWVCRDRPWWREVFLLAAGRARPRMFGQAVALINALCDSDCQMGQPMGDEQARAVALAAQAAAEVRLPEQARSPGRYQDTLQKLQRWLVGIIQQGALPLKERAEVGRLLSALGDPRPDVACPIPALVTVPAGEFIMGSDKYDDEKPQHRVTLPKYRIGKYPVTNAQYRRFVEDGGYTDKWQVCWTDAGWRWREDNNIKKPPLLDDPQWNLDNHPVVGVSWYEAVAYCNWLTQTDVEGRTFRLPTEAEWEKAARGADGREWPWGNEFDPEKANTRESDIGRTTAVGLFPHGASPYGAQDMAGNVWEWCATRWQAYSENYPALKGENEWSDQYLEGDDDRVLRGGSFGTDAQLVRGTCRSRLRPWGWSTYRGFRCVLWL